MDKKTKEALIEYQCSGCVIGCDMEEYESTDTFGIQCTKHVPGSLMLPVVGRIFLGMPRGFCRLGKGEQRLLVFKNFSKLCDGWNYGKYDVPAWKHLHNNEHVLVRGISPRINVPFLHVILENCMDKINCMEITNADIVEMD